MNKFLIGLLLVVGTVVRADDVVSALAPYDSRGVSIVKYVDGASITFTNNAVEPWFPVSIANKIATGVTNVIDLTVVRIYDTAFQYRQDDVTTNIFGQIVTNTYEQVTNFTYRVWTGTVASVSVSTIPQPITTLFQFRADDVIGISQTDTNGKDVVISGRR